MQVKALNEVKINHKAENVNLIINIKSEKTMKSKM